MKFATHGQEMKLLVKTGKICGSMRDSQFSVRGKQLNVFILKTQKSIKFLLISEMHHFGQTSKILEKRIPTLLFSQSLMEVLLTILSQQFLMKKDSNS